MTLSRHQESSKDQEQGKMGAKPLQKSVSEQQTNLLYYRPAGKINNLSLKFYRLIVVDRWGNKHFFIILELVSFSCL